LSKYYILMGDVIGSRRHNARALAKQLGALIARCNHALGPKTLSPYTVTLGDEFQGVSTSLFGVVETIVWLEEAILRSGYEFKLHYVAHWGEIDTPINPLIAHGMMGPGLTRARAVLTEKHKERPRIAFDFAPSPATAILNDVAFALAGNIDIWKRKDFELVVSMIDTPDNAEVAQQHDRDRTTVWRRRKHLRVADYIHLKSALLALGTEFAFHTE